MRLAYVIPTIMLAVAACSAPPVAHNEHPPAEAGDTVTVRLSDFAFTPDALRLHAGATVRLRLVNDSDGAHDFSAPAFFAASTYPTGMQAPANGTVDVGPGQTVELTVTPGSPGTYPVECTHLLHALFGMTASIDVVR